MFTFVGNLSLHFSGMWCGLLHDICSKFRMCLVILPLRVEKSKRTNMLSRTFGHQLPVKWHHIPRKKGVALHSVAESLQTHIIDHSYTRNSVDGS
jgi:hypothetical protein